MLIVCNLVIGGLTVEVSPIFHSITYVTSKVWNVEMISQRELMLIFTLNQVLHLNSTVSGKCYVLQLICCCLSYQASKQFQIKT